MLRTFRQSAGFTLVEVLVVVLIIGVLLTFASLSINSRAELDTLETEAKRLHQLFRLASEEAELKGYESGFRYSDKGYEFLALDPGRGWDPISGGPLRARPIPQPLAFELKVEGRAVPPGPERVLKDDADDDEKERSASDDDTDLFGPQVLILSSGELSAFELVISIPTIDAAYTLEGNSVGQLKLQSTASGSN